MKRLLFSFIGVMCSILACFPDGGVGLVMSGGGAKGAVHIGIIQALEENDIPIDYVAGTSIGAVVGSMYAMGYTPQEMLDLLMSKEFYYWQTGKVEEDYQYYFRKGLDEPSFVNFNIPLGRSGKKLDASILPNSLVNPIQMNQAFMQLFAQVNAQSGGDFDNLFVPFLCVAADVYHKKPVIFRAGDLGDAVRASMSFPMVFKPIIQDSVPLWDGGIYDNFPVEPMKQAFHPAFMIGSVVADSAAKRPSEQSVIEQLTDMIMQKTDYQINPAEGVLMNFNLSDVGLLDFDKGQTLYDLGYNTTIAMIDSIKGRITERRPYAEVQAHRAAYNASLPPLVFKNIYITGADEAQQEYIKNQIHWQNERFTIEDFKKVYFRLLANSKITEIMPHAEYDTETQAFDLFLEIKVENDIKVAFGGNVSSLSANQIYLGAAYQSLNEYSSVFTLDAQLGNAYSGFVFQGKVELPHRIPMNLAVVISGFQQKFFDNDKLFLDTDLAAFIKQQTTYGRMGVGFPLRSDSKVDFLAGYALMNDYYFPTNPSSFIKALTDKSLYHLFNFGVYLRKNSLDAKQFPIEGKKHNFYVQYLTGKENYYPMMATKRTNHKSLSYIQLNIGVNTYYNINSLFNLGYLAKGVVSNQELGCNYTASVLQAPGFTPTPHSQLIYNEAFHANQYVAGGLIPILKLSSMVHLRGDFYGFMPIKAIKKGENNSAYYGDLFKDFAYSGEISLVARLPFMSVSLYANHYSYPKGNWNFGLNLGYLIFGPQFVLN
jgi:NTE family protein